MATEVDSSSLLAADEPHVKRRRMSFDEAENEQDVENMSRLSENEDSLEEYSDARNGNEDERKSPDKAAREAAGDENDGGGERTEEKQDYSDSNEGTEEEVVKSKSKVKSIKSKNVKKKKVKTKTKTKTKKKSIHRKDIRKIMTVDQLDEETLAAQKEEAERLQRIAEKQQNLRQVQAASASLLPVSFEDALNRIADGDSDSGMTLSLSDLYDDLEIPSVTQDEPELRRSLDQIKEDEKPKPKPPKSGLEVQIEHEVFTLSSDDEEARPVESAGVKMKINSVSEEGPNKLGYDNFCTSGGVVYEPSSGGSASAIITLEDEEPAKPKPTMEAQAHEDSDSDDCMVISPPPSDQEEDKDDEANNIPDEFGRVLVNIGHPESDPDIFLPPRIAEAMKPHQIGGVRFLYDNLVESLERFESSSGFGCIVAHSMGLGKTIQAAAFCEIFIRCTSARTVLVIVPINTIQNWSHEFNHWLPTEVNSSALNGKRKAPQAKKSPGVGVEDNSPGSDQVAYAQSPEEESQSKQKRLNLFVLNETIKTLESREKIISEWGREGGVLLIGYEMYRMLALRKLKKGAKKKKPFAFPESRDDASEQNELLDKIHRSLVRPGPDLVICDEGHRIKNSGASISQALKAIRTRRRVVLTGYPLQNNLMEYWCMVDFIRPNYLGTKAEFSNMFERPISNGQCADSTPGDRRLMQFRSHVLHSLLQGFVQRKSHAVLKRALPPKQEHVFLVKMSPIQFQLYKEYINYIQLQVNMGHSTPNPIKAFAVCSKLWNHPDVLYRVMKKKQSVLLDDLELEDLADEVKKLKKTTKSGSASALDYPDNSSPSNSNSDSFFNGRECFFTGAGPGTGAGENSNSRKDTAKQGQDSLISLEWASSCFQDYIPGVLENGTKFQLLFVIIEETLAVGDKLLIFSQSLLTLDLMETFLAAEYEWKKGQDYFRLDGSTQGLEREKLINEFNGQHSASVFLVSTKAGSLGVNLVGANRVVVFDASWNPCHDCQAVCRIYRYGQKKPCQIYRFVTDYTLEKQIYDRQIHKGGMANRVVDEMNPDSHFNSKELLSTLLLEIRDLERSQNEIVQHDGEVSNFSDGVIRTLLEKCGNKITRKPFEHESLLIDRKEKKLSAAERRLALRNYEIEKKAAANYTNGGGRGPNHTSGGGIVYPGRSGDTSSGWTGGSSSYSSYASAYGGRDAGLSKPVASIRPYQRGIYDQDSLSMVPNKKPAGSNMNWSAVIEDLRRRGVLTTQVIKLRRNYVMPNPKGGSDVYLRPGDKIELIRARRCSYIRLASGQFMAMRHGSRGFTFLDTIPFSQQLNPEQLTIFLSSFLREIPAEYAARHLYHQSPLTYSAPAPEPSGTSAASSASVSSSSSRFNYRQSQGHGEPPVSFPLPPSLPYGSYSSNQNVRLSGQHVNSSGGGVRIWLKDHIENSAAARLARRSASVNSGGSSLVPDMELIKIGSGLSSSRSSASTSTHSFSRHNDSGGSYFSQNPRFPAPNRSDRDFDFDQISIMSAKGSNSGSGSYPPDAAAALILGGESSLSNGSGRGSSSSISDLARMLAQSPRYGSGSVNGHDHGHGSRGRGFSQQQHQQDFDESYLTPSHSHSHLSSGRYSAFDPDNMPMAEPPEIEIMKVGGGGGGSRSGVATATAVGPSNGYNADLYSDFSFNGSGAMAEPGNADRNLRHQQQYFVNESPLPSAEAAVDLSNNDSLILPHPQAIYPCSHKVQDTDRFNYS